MKKLLPESIRNGLLLFTMAICFVMIAGAVAVDSIMDKHPAHKTKL